MSAGKRPTSSSLPPDQHRSRDPKRPKLDDRAALLSLSPRVRLRWDGAARRVVPAEGQIGVPWSRLAPFVDSPPRRRSGSSSRLLADVASVPKEIFALENLKRVLSYEVWDKYLTEDDMKFLAQFLPIGTNTEETVHSLLTGKNHHFGNPMLTWSSALCYGDLHPDAVVSKERQIRADKKAYRAQLSEYHSDMTETLTKWKEKWLTCENPESLFRDKPAKHRKGDLQSRAENTISSKPPNNNTMPLKVVRNGDVTKFMSYIKITRSQYDLVKRMKQSGDGIQTRQLAGVLGDIGNFHVKPYETLMEDEKKKLRAYWAILSSKELPAAFEARRERKLMAENLRTSLCLELAGEEAEQVAGRTAYQNGGISDEEQELVDHSPEDVPQDEDEDEDERDNDKSDTDTSTDSHDSTDQDVNGTSDTGTPTDSHDSPNEDAMDTNNTDVTTQSPQGSADEGDQEPENSSGMNTSANSGNSSGKQHKDMEDTSCKDFNPGAEEDDDDDDDDVEDTSRKDTVLQDHNIPDMQLQEPKAMNHTISPIQGIHSPDMPVQGCTNTSYAIFPIHSNGGLDEQTDDLKNMCYPSASMGHGSKNEMDCMILDDQREPESITTAMTSDSSTLLVSKPPLHNQDSVEEGPELKGPAKYQEVLWQSVNPVDSSFNNHTPGSGLYAQPGALQLKHQLSGGPAASMISLGIDSRRQQQAQIAVTAALPMCSPASLLPPFTNRLNGIGMVPSYSAGHMNGMKQSAELQHSMTNGHLAQSGLVLHSMTNGHLAQSGLVQEQMQLLDERHNGLYSQQVENTMYSGSTLGTFPMVDPQNFVAVHAPAGEFAGHAPAGESCSWFPNEQPSHNNNWSGLGSNGIVLGQDLPTGDGSLSSVLSQYKQVSSRSSVSDQSLGRRNLVPPHGGVAGSIALPSPAMHGYTQNNNVASSQVDGVSLQWAQGSHGNGMAHPPPFKQFGRDPWSR